MWGSLMFVSMSRAGAACNAEAKQMTTVSSTGQVRLLGWDDLKARGITVSKPTIYRKVKEGKFPAPIYASKFPA